MFSHIHVKILSLNQNNNLFIYSQKYITYTLFEKSEKVSCFILRKGECMSANFGYIRVSTKEQNIDRQKEELIKQGADE